MPFDARFRNGRTEMSAAEAADRRAKDAALPKPLFRRTMKSGERHLKLLISQARRDLGEGTAYTRTRE